MAEWRSPSTSGYTAVFQRDRETRRDRRAASCVFVVHLRVCYLRPGALYRDEKFRSRTRSSEKKFCEKRARYEKLCVASRTARWTTSQTAAHFTQSLLINSSTRVSVFHPVFESFDTSLLACSFSLQLQLKQQSLSFLLYLFMLFYGAAAALSGIRRNK